jgi:hypothetical protein
VKKRVGWLLSFLVAVLWSCGNDTVTVLPPPGPNCLVSKHDINIGTVAMGDSADTTITIVNFDPTPFNDPPGPFTIDVSASCPQFSVIGTGQYTLAANESHEITVRFKPTSTGTRSCTVETGPSFCRDIDVTGTGVP